LEAAEYEAVRAHPRRFLIALNHENPEIERVVDENGQFAVVETFVGEASRIAEETDPRALKPATLVARVPSRGHVRAKIFDRAGA
jgi:hypothetical protein